MTTRGAWFVGMQLLIAGLYAWGDLQHTHLVITALWWCSVVALQAPHGTSATAA